MHRRTFLRTSLAAAAFLSLPASAAHRPVDGRSVATVAFPEKRPLITYSDRPPLLETPRSFFSNIITPNDAFFVRWHSAKIPMTVDAETFTLKIGGAVDNVLLLTVNDLKHRYEAVEITAVLQCGGNSRSAFVPTTSGIQWGNGAMGCARWKGARLKDILRDALPNENARYISFTGRDTPVFNRIPRLVRELRLNELSDDIIVAYEMNGSSIPLLNGFPLRLVIPGLYSDSWIKMLDTVVVSEKPRGGYYMNTAYRVPDNACECERPDRHAEKTKPIARMNVKSLIGAPLNGFRTKKGVALDIAGVAFDGGSGIAKVDVSVDGGKSWKAARLEPALSLYAFRKFTFRFVPQRKGPLVVMARAFNRLGEAQPFPEAIRWNHGGYKYNGIDAVAGDVV